MVSRKASLNSQLRLRMAHFSAVPTFHARYCLVGEKHRRGVIVLIRHEGLGGHFRDHLWNGALSKLRVQMLDIHSSEGTRHRQETDTTTRADFSRLPRVSY